MTEAQIKFQRLAAEYDLAAQAIVELPSNSPDIEDKYFDFGIARAKYNRQKQVMLRYSPTHNKSWYDFDDELQAAYAADPYIADPHYYGLSFDAYVLKVSKDDFDCLQLVACEYLSY